MADSPFAAIILAAGWSSRLGQFKPLLHIGGKSMLEHLIIRYQSCGVADIRVVAGNRANEVMAVATQLGAMPILNPDFSTGMWSSVVCGVSNLVSSNKGFFIHPVDIPLIRLQTLRDMTAAFETGAIHYPTFQQQRGHPPLIAGGYIPDIINYGGQGGLRQFLLRHESRSIDIPVADRFILKDIDTPADYQWALERIDRYDIPSVDECRELMTRRLHVPGRVLSHCEAVATLAKSIGKALVDAGCPLDIDCIVSAALVHDLSRQFPHHAEAGASLLRDMAFPRLADIVAVHMDLSVMAETPITEAEVVFLADKLIEDDHVVDLESRYRNKLSRYASDPAAWHAIIRRMEQAMASRRRIEMRIGHGVW
jgi:CTP:molybdopterin cytidylyltransferase MocA